MTGPALAEKAAGVVTLGDGGLTLEELARVARSGAVIALSNDAKEAIARGATALARHARAGRPIYGLTTGVGALDACDIAPEESSSQRQNLLRSHAAGVGQPMPDEQVRAMIAARVSALARGHSGVELGLVEALVDLLRLGVTPIVPEGGSVGASDLAPLAHVGLSLLGEGRARFRGEVLPAADALARVGLRPLELHGRDALALINGLAQTTAIGALATLDARRLVAAAELGAAMTLLATRAPRDFLDERLDALKSHGPTADSAQRLRELTATPRRGPGLRLVASEISGSQDLRTRLSSRYAPSTFGACRDAVAAAERAVTTELNAAVDNPVLDETWITSNSGLTNGQVVGEALDALATSVTALAVISERRTASLQDPAHSGGLPAFLLHPRVTPGVHFGFMMAQCSAASLVAELRCRSIAASVQSIPTCAGTEDYVSMSALAARRAAWSVARAEYVVAIELLCAAQALDVASLEPTASMATGYAALRSRVPTMIEDRVLGEDIEAVVALLREDALG